MSVLQNNTVLEAKFTNNARDTVEALWQGEDGKIHSYYFPADDPENPDYKHLESIGWDYEAIIDATAEHIRKEAKALKEIHTFLAGERIKEIEEEFEVKWQRVKDLNKGALEKNNILNAIIEHNTDEEALFQCKLAVFEMKGVKGSKNKSLKTKIRKSESIVELIMAVHDKF